MQWVTVIVSICLLTAPVWAASRPARTQAGRTTARSQNPSRSVTVRAPGPRVVVARAGAAPVAVRPDIHKLLELTEYCRAQYTSCMDNFCNVLDDNQGRCSCSANLKNYAKTEEALKQATEDLQDVAQKIQYIGLTSDEVETLFKQTEAELAMQQNSDNTQLKNDLDRIKNMIVDVKAGTTTTTDTGMSLDLSGLLDFSFSSTGFDLASLFGGNNNTTSISNQRGADLYKTATARCKASVLNSCTAQGVDASVVTNAYDLEIDKQCIAYERSLTDTNTQMTQTVRNAKSVLQKARLLVAQQKNAYDLRGCINALDSCMQDDFVCGSDYENCLDPTGKYIVNGKIVVGGMPGVSGGELTNSSPKHSGLYSVWNYSADNAEKNAWGNGSLSDYINNTVTDQFTAGDQNNMAIYLQKKIGWVDTNGRSQGMCMSVLNKCQDVTYTGKTGDKKYNPVNEVVKQYLARTLVQIKSAQDEVLADHAETCIADVASCLAQNNYSSNFFGNQQSGTDSNNPSNVAIRACMSIINTCKSVTERTADEKTVYEWLNEALGTQYKKS